MADNNERTSSFNEGVLQIQRLNYLWGDANELSRSGDLKSWRWTLDTIWRELSRDAVHDYREFDPVDFESIKESEWVKGYDKLVEKVKEAKNHGEMYACLHDLEVFLRILQDKVGKGGKYYDPSEDEMD